MKITALGYPASIKSQGRDEGTSEIEIVVSQIMQNEKQAKAALERQTGVISVNRSTNDARNLVVKY